MRSFSSSASVHIAAALLTSLIIAGTAAAQAPAQGYKETVSGTVVGFEMAPVPGGSVTIGGTTVKVEPFLIGRTEVTWDMYDLFSAGDPKDPGGADAVAPLLAGPARVLISHDAEQGLAAADWVLGLRGGRQAIWAPAGDVTLADVRGLYA